jgi:regulator of nucleoside diphosphate kinase
MSCDPKELDMTLHVNACVATIPGGKPDVIVDARHYTRLHDLALSDAERAPEVAALLLDELARAELRPSGEVPVDVVTIGSEATFRYNDNGRSQTVQLVWPHDANISEARISVFTPIGATLLGLSKGDTMEWTTRYGETRSLTVLNVRPPAALRKVEHALERR